MNKTIIKSFLVFTFFFVGTSWAEQSPLSMSSADAEKHLAIVNEPKSSEKDMLESISKLSPFSYEEIFNVFAERVTFEYSNQNPNKKLIVELTHYIADRAAVDNVPTMKRLLGLLKYRYKNVNRPEDYQVVVLFEGLIKQAEMNHAKLPSIHDSAILVAMAAPKVSTKNTLPIAYNKKKLVVGEFYKFLVEQSREANKSNEGFSSEETLTKVIIDVITDKVRTSINNGTFIEVSNRDDVINNMMDRLTRMTSRVVLLEGDQGVGKFTVVQNLAKKIVMDEFSQTPEFIKAFRDAEIIEIPAAGFKSAKTLDTSLSMVKMKYAKLIGKQKPLIIYINNISDFVLLPPAMLNKILEMAGETESDYRFIFSGTSEEIKTLFKSNAFARDYFTAQKSIVSIPKMTNSEVVKSLKQNWIPNIEAQYGVVFSDEALATLAEKAVGVRPQFAQPESTVLLLQDLAVETHKNKVRDIDAADVNDFVADGKKVAASPLEDAEIVKKLLILETELNKEIKGQAIANKMVANVAKKFLSTKVRKKAMSFMTIGSTGVGKTELGKVLHRVLFPGTEAAVVPLGEILETHDSAKVFGAPPGYVGSDKDALFETALKKLPEGGVIILDEASNMGGTDKAKKDALFKKFYQISYEPTWTSPVDGTVYDLTKYIFQYTGNDGDKLFIGVGSDDMRKAIWADNSSKNKVDALLVEAGIPEPFLGRQAAVVLMEPLVEEVKGEISQKFLDQLDSTVRKEFPGVKVSYDQKFLAQLGQSFYSHNAGARSIAKFTEDRFGALLITTILDYAMDEKTQTVDIKKLDGMEIRLSLVDNKPSRPYIKEGFERKAEITVELVKGNKVVVSKTEDVTRDAATVILVTKGNAMATAAHEAGHALLNEPTLTAMKLAHVTIVGSSAGKNNYLGYARYEPLQGIYNLTYEGVIARIAQLYAGSLAQQKAGYPMDSGWANDKEVAAKTAADAILKYGFEKEFVGVQFDKDHEPIFTEVQKQKFEDKKLELLGKGEKLANLILDEQWQVIRSTQAELVRKGFMSGDRFKEIKEVALKSQYGKRSYQELMEAVNSRKAQKSGNIGGRPACENILSKIAGLK